MKAPDDIRSVSPTMVHVEYTCPLCGKTTKLDIPAKGAWDYFVKGKYVQNAFPELNADTREVLVSGICPECQKGVFKDPEE